MDIPTKSVRKKVGLIMLNLALLTLPRTLNLLVATPNTGCAAEWLLQRCVKLVNGGNDKALGLPTVDPKREELLETPLCGDPFGDSRT